MQFLRWYWKAACLYSGKRGLSIRLKTDRKSNKIDGDTGKAYIGIQAQNIQFASK
jgi:hypothetical protein